MDIGNGQTNVIPLVSGFCTNTNSKRNQWIDNK